MLIHRVQLPEDTALSQVAVAATPAPNPSTAATTLGEQTANSTSAPQTQETTSPETQLPTAGENTGTTGSTRPALIWNLIDYMWNDPHSRICEFWSC